MNAIIENAIQKGISYSAYSELLIQLAEEGKTTGPKQTDSLIGYTKLNAARSKRLNKKARLEEAVISYVQSIKRAQTWLIITEAWCGDAAQILPIINHLAELNEKIKVRLVLRDENPELMDLFLTGTSRSIPMVIVYDEMTHQLITSWGPRPDELQQSVIDRKADPNPKPYAEFSEDLQRWYIKDKGLKIQAEFVEALRAVE